MVHVLTWTIALVAILALFRVVVWKCDSTERVLLVWAVVLPNVVLLYGRDSLLFGIPAAVISYGLVLAALWRIRPTRALHKS